MNGGGAKKEGAIVDRAAISLLLTSTRSREYHSFAMASVGFEF